MDATERETPRFSLEELVKICFEVAGAATRPLMQDHPDYVFPSNEVADAVRWALHEHGIDDLPEGYR